MNASDIKLTAKTKWHNSDFNNEKRLQKMFVCPDYITKDLDMSYTIIVLCSL